MVDGSCGLNTPICTGLTPEDLRWWFAHIGGDVTIGTTVMSRYHAWHPADHIHWALVRPGPNGVAEVGARFHIVEAFGRDMNHLVDVVEEVTRLDQTGITLEKRVLGQVGQPTFPLLRERGERRKLPFDPHRRVRDAPGMPSLECRDPAPRLSRGDGPGLDPA
jgi:hypothetical protein